MSDADFKRSVHRAIASILDCLDSDFLQDHGIAFGGGTRISMALDEFRESVDLDLLCPSVGAYRAARETVNNQSLGKIIRADRQDQVNYAKEIRIDRYGIRTWIVSQNIHVKVELIAMDDYRLGTEKTDRFPVPVIDETACFISKLLANSDRGDVLPYKDIVDLLMMVKHWGDIPDAAWVEAERHYGSAVQRDLRRNLSHFIRLGGPQMQDCKARLKMNDATFAALLDEQQVTALQRAGPPSHGFSPNGC